MPNNIAHFDIPADDVERARRFYERVFGWRFDTWGPPDYYLIHTGRGDGDPAIHGAVTRRNQPVVGTGRTGYECTIAVDDLGAITAAITANGGRILMDEFEIVGVGRLIRFEDTEGNTVCAMHYMAERWKR